jgi:2,3-bisphosphoglycerate-dependent phosphoglycerate mutase
MPTLTLLRHGESQWNLENRFTGWVDVPLSPKGEQEAKRAGELLKDIPIDKVYTSVLQRAMETARIALEVRGTPDLPVERDKALNERMYGDLQGLNKDETAQKFGAEQVHIWRRSYDIPPPNGESLKDTAARTLPYFNEHIVPDIKAGKNVLVAAHGNSLRSIVMELDKLTKEQVLELNIPTGTPLVYQLDDNGNVLSSKYLKD